LIVKIINFLKLSYKNILRRNGQGYKCAHNILIIILMPKEEDRRTYSIVECSKNIGVLPDK
jgi:hypothetical protein